MHASSLIDTASSGYAAAPRNEGWPPRTRSSLDTLIIPGRTRLPSSNLHQPGPSDIQIAQNLLRAESQVSLRNTAAQQMSTSNSTQPRAPVGAAAEEEARRQRFNSFLFPSHPGVRPRQPGEIQMPGTEHVFPPVYFQPPQSVGQMENTKDRGETITARFLRSIRSRLRGHGRQPRQSVGQTESTKESEETTPNLQARDTSGLLDEAGSAAQGPQAAHTLLNVGSRAVPREPVASHRSALDMPRRPQLVEETLGSPTSIISKPLNEAQIPQVRDTNDHLNPQPTLRSGTDFSSRGLEHHDLARSYDGPRDISSSAATTTSWATASGGISSFGVIYGYRDTQAAVVEYNCLSTEHKIGVLTVEAVDGVGSDGGEPIENTSKNTSKLLDNARKLKSAIDKLRRSASSSNMKKTGPLSNPLSNKSDSDLPPTGTERPQKILQGQSLEKFCTLGGISSLQLPQHFAAHALLVVPSSVAQLSYYILRHGLTVPGIFRVSGQQSTINALYDYYSIKDARKDGGKILHTVTDYNLPGHIEYTVHDVTSVLKKIVSGFEGGLLGSVWLYEAFQDIEENLRRKPDQSETEFTGLKARFLALALLSVHSDERFHLICAILGLTSLIGHMSEKLKAQSTDSSSTKELMDYRALGVVFGPSLLLADIPNSDKKPGALPESSKKSRKQDTATEQKLLTDDVMLKALRGIQSQVKVAEMLLSNWQDVVKQMHHVTMNGTKIIRRGESSQRLASEESKYSLQSSKATLGQGVQSPGVFIDPSISARQAKMSSRSSSRPDLSRKSGISSGASTRRSQRLESSGSSSSGGWFHNGLIETDSSESAPMLRSADSQSQLPRQLGVTHTTGGKKVQFAGTSKTASQEKPTQSMHPSDNTLPHHPYLSEQSRTHANTPYYETNEQREDGSFSDAQMSNYEDLLAPEEPAHVEAVGTMRQQENLRLPDAGMESSSDWPLRYDTLPPEARVNVAHHNLQTPGRARHGGEALLHNTDAIDSSEHNRVKTIAERFSRPSHGHYVPPHHESGFNPTVYADVNALPLGSQPSTPSFLQRDRPSPSQRAHNNDVRAKESLIPRPVHSSGRGRRQGNSHSPSSTTETTPITQFRPRPSALHLTNVDPSDHLTTPVASNPNELDQPADSGATMSRNANPVPSEGVKVAKLYEEIMQLREELAKKNEQEAQARRSLEIAKETGSLKDKSSEPSGGSRGKEEMREEMEFWKKRAQELERQRDEGSQTAEEPASRDESVAEGTSQQWSKDDTTARNKRWRDTM